MALMLGDMILYRKDFFLICLVWLGDNAKSR